MKYLFVCSICNITAVEWIPNLSIRIRYHSKCSIQTAMLITNKLYFLPFNIAAVNVIINWVKYWITFAIDGSLEISLFIGTSMVYQSKQLWANHDEIKNSSWSGTLQWYMMCSNERRINLLTILVHIISFVLFTKDGQVSNIELLFRLSNTHISMKRIQCLTPLPVELKS